MRRDIALLFGMLAGWAAAGAQASMEATTSDGRRVLLHDDYTWSFEHTVDEPSLEQLVLSVEKTWEMSSGCKLGLRLQNNATYRVKSLTPFFTAYNREHTAIKTQTRSFDSISPTFSEYGEIEFTGLSCADIAYVTVHGGDRCTMGDLNKYDGTKGECLKRVRVQSSELIKILKKPPE